MRTLRAHMENEPEVMMRITALLKRKGFLFKRIEMSDDAPNNGAWLNITFLENGPEFMKAVHTVENVVHVHSVEEINL